MKQPFIVNETIAQSYAIEAESSREAIEARERGEGVELTTRTVSRNANLRQLPQESLERIAPGAQQQKKKLR